MHHPVDVTPAASGDAPVDEVHIVPYDCSLSDNLMAVPPGIFMTFTYILVSK